MHSSSPSPRRRDLSQFAPVPFRALESKTLSLSAFRLLAHLLGLWINQYRPQLIEVSDHQLLGGRTVPRSGGRFPGCGLSRNTLIKARTELQDLGFIKTELAKVQNQEHIYSYELVEGMALNHSTPKCQDLTVGVSAIDSPYVEEKKSFPCEPRR